MRRRRKAAPPHLRRADAMHHLHVRTQLGQPALPGAGVVLQGRTALEQDLPTHLDATALKHEAHVRVAQVAKRAGKHCAQAGCAGSVSNCASYLWA